MQKKFMRFYHGTAGVFGDDILKNGFASKNCTWSCSCSDNTYMWKYNVSEYEDEEEFCDDSTPINHEGFFNAFENALLTAAMHGVFTRDIIVFGFDIPIEHIGDGNEVDNDISCENMCGAFQISSKTLNEMIQSGEITVHVYRFQNGYKPFMRWFYLMSINENYMRIEDEEYDDFQFFKGAVSYNCETYEALFSDPVWDYEEIEFVPASRVVSM